MRPVVFDKLERWFLRLQATLAIYPMAALPLVDRDARAALFWAAVATDIARWALSRLRWPPLVLGGALVCCALALCVAAVAGGAASPPLPAPSPDRAGAPLFDPKSGFLSAVEAAGGGDFLFSLLVAMFVGQAGAFLMFAGERSPYLRRHKVAETPGLLGPRRLAAVFGLQFLFILIGLFAVFSGLVLKGAPADPSAALASAAWRIATAERFVIPSSVAVVAAMVAWALLNVNASRQELRRKVAPAPSEKESGQPDRTPVSA